MLRTFIFLVCFVLAVADVEVTVTEKAKPFKWPIIGHTFKSTPHLVKVGKRIANRIGCEVCSSVVEDAVLAEVRDQKDPDAIDEFLEDVLEDKITETDNICGPAELLRAFEAKKMDILTPKNGSAALVPGGEGNHALATESDFKSSVEEFNFLGFAFHHACTEDFRSKSGRAVVKSMKKAFHGEAKEQYPDKNDLPKRLHASAVEGCRKASLCVTQILEEELELKTIARDAKRAESDPTFEKPSEDHVFADTPEHEGLNFYMILGVDEHAPVSKFKENYAILRDYAKMAKSFWSAAGSVEQEKKKKAKEEYVPTDLIGDPKVFMNVVNLAYKVLSDQATRRQYDRDRDRNFLLGPKKKPDKIIIDGQNVILNSPYKDMLGKVELSQNDEF